MCIRYAARNNLIEKPRWEWVPTYFDSDKSLVDIVHTYRTSVLHGKKYKFGIKIPKSHKSALALDKTNQNSLWEKSVRKEMDQIVDKFDSFIILHENKPASKGYKRVSYHLIFACKVDLRRKTRLVIDGNRSPPIHKEDCYTPVVSVEAIRLGFLLAQMNDLRCVAGDVGNAFFTSFTTGKFFVIAGPDFGADIEGKRLLIEKSIYGIRSAAAYFHDHFLINCVRYISDHPLLTQTYA